MIFFVSTVAAFLVCFIMLPVIIKVAKSIDLLDAPDTRKIHEISTPSMGGIAIFSGIMLATFMALPLKDLEAHKLLLSGISMIFILGIRDDVSSLQARYKLLVQLFAAFVVVFFADIRLTGLYGIAGIYELPYPISGALTVFAIVTLTNSFNLIDGIDGLAGSVGVFILSFLALVFMFLNQNSLAIICLTTVGSLMAFLYFNWYPSKVFMGDTGSMLLGFMVSVLTVVLINAAEGLQITSMIQINSSVALAVALLIIPIYDTLRVFCIRFYNGKSPLDPDRNHIHHSLLRIGLNHAQSTLILVSFNVFIVIFSLSFNSTVSNTFLIPVQFMMALAFGSVLDYLVYRKRLAKSTATVEAKEIYISKSA